MQKKKTILLIGNRDDDLEIISNIIQCEGYPVETTTSTDEARKKLTTLPADLIIVDSEIAEMTGPGFVSFVKADPKLVKIPVIILTKPDATEDVIKGIDAGADDYLSKSSRPEIILTRIRAMLKIGQLRQDVQRLEKIKDRFLSICSHDLRSLPGVIITAVKEVLARDKKLAEGDIEKLNIAIDKARITLNLIDDILVYGMIGDGKLKIEPEDTNLNYFLKEIIKGLKPELEEKSLRLNYRFQLPNPTLSLDPLRFKQVVSTIILNATSCSLKDFPLEITVSEASHNNKSLAAIAVRDFGPGMTEEETKTIFEYSRGKTKKPAKSTVLGLTIARELTLLHGGDILISSRKGEGSTFTILLPLKGK